MIGPGGAFQAPKNQANESNTTAAAGVNDASTAISIIRGHVYRARRPAPVSGLVNDRQVLHIGLDTVQYDSPAIARGGKYKTVSREAFAVWAVKDVTDQLPNGEWQTWSDFKK